MASCRKHRVPFPLFIADTSVLTSLSCSYVPHHRRLVKRIYVPLPEGDTRLQLLTHMLQKQEQASREAGGGGKSNLSQKSVANIVRKTEGYSASDMTAVRSGHLLLACRCI